MRKIILTFMAGLTALSLTACNITYKSTEVGNQPGEIVVDGEGVLRFCYTDEKYKEFLEFCEKEYERFNSDVDVVLEYRAESSEYLNQIIEDSFANENVADVYMLSDSNLSTAYLAGVAMKNSFADFNEDNYSKTALNACSYIDKLVAYPLSYDTTFMLYRSDILSPDDVSTFGNLILVSDTMETLGDDYPEVQAIFSSDLNDIFINYGYIGAGFNIGGKTGSETGVLEIASPKASNLSEKYIALIKYFAINNSLKNQDVLDGFLTGKYVSVIASTANLSEIIESELEYSIVEFPNFSNVNKTAPLALTKCVAVNPFADDTAIASDFARFVTYEAASFLYEYSGTLSARRGVAYTNPQLANIYASYEKASIKNKLAYGEQVYPLLEIAMHNIVAGNAAKDELKSVEDYMKNQIN